MASHVPLEVRQRGVKGGRVAGKEDGSSSISSSNIAKHRSAGDVKLPKGKLPSHLIAPPSGLRPRQKSAFPAARLMKASGPLVFPLPSLGSLSTAGDERGGRVAAVGNSEAERALTSSSLTELPPPRLPKRPQKNISQSAERKKVGGRGVEWSLVGGPLSGSWTEDRGRS